MQDEVDVAVRGPVSARHNRDGTEVAMDGLYDDVPCCLASPAAQEHCAHEAVDLALFHAPLCSPRLLVSCTDAYGPDRLPTLRYFPLRLPKISVRGSATSILPSKDALRGSGCSLLVSPIFDSPHGAVSAGSQRPNFAAAPSHREQQC
jgi:hypothetical protein